MHVLTKNWNCSPDSFVGIYLSVIPSWGVHKHTIWLDLADNLGKYILKIYSLHPLKNISTSKLITLSIIWAVLSEKRDTILLLTYWYIVHTKGLKYFWHTGILTICDRLIFSYTYMCIINMLGWFYTINVYLLQTWNGKRFCELETCLQYVDLCHYLLGIAIYYK